MGVKKEERQFVKYNYLDFYDHQTAEAIDWLWNGASSMKKSPTP
jgi:hypothetical protein